MDGASAATGEKQSLLPPSQQEGLRPDQPNEGNPAASQEMAASFLKTSTLSVRKKLFQQTGFPVYCTSHGFYEEDVKKKLQQFTGGSIDLQKEDDGIGILTLNNPSKKNALSGVMMLQLLEKVIELENWKEGKGLIVCGAKNTFCSGSDLNTVKSIGTSKVFSCNSALENMKAIIWAQYTLLYKLHKICKKEETQDGVQLCMFMQNTLTRFMRLPLISVALVQGRAMGGGAEFTTACDFRLMTPSSEIRFVHKEMGIIPSWGGTARLIEIVGSRQTLKILSGALKLESTVALKIGIADEILQSSDESQSLEEARRWLQQFISGPPEVIRALKTVVSSGRELALEEALETERDILSTLWGGPANLEAVAKNKKFNK